MIFFPPSYQKYVTQFFNSYELEAIAISPEDEMSNVKDEKDRVCRFCNRRFPYVTFKSKAHIIPHFLGNKYLVADFECDACNKKFGRYDQHLSHFIGLTRTLMNTEGKNGVPTLFSRDEKVKAGRESIFGIPMIKFGSAVNNPENVNFNPDLNEYSITYEKKPYVPFNVYRSLLKMALSMLRDEDTKGYQVGFNILHAKTPLGAINKNIYSVIRHLIPGSYEETFAYLFKRKPESIFVPPHTMVLIYKNLMLQIFLSFQMEYLNQMVGRSVAVPVFPPYFDGTGSDKYPAVDPQLIDLSSKELMSENETIGFRVDPEQQGERKGVDLNTEKSAKHDFDPNRIVGFYLTKPGTQIQLPDQNMGNHEQS